MTNFHKHALRELEVTRLLYESFGEISPEIEKLLKLKEESLADDVDFLHDMMARLDVEVMVLKNRANEINEFAKRLSNLKERSKDELTRFMIDHKKEEVLGNDWRYILMKSNSVEVDELAIEGKYLREKITYSADKETIGRLLREGENIPGARLVASQYPRAYPNTKGKKK